MDMQVFKKDLYGLNMALQTKQGFSDCQYFNILSKVQIYICPPGAQCDVISKWHMGYTFSFGSVGSALRNARKV